MAAVSYMLHLVKQEPGYRLDDQDHFANRRIRSVGELIQNQVRIGLSRMERVVRERMTTQDVEAITPTTLVNIRPVVAAIKEFFGTSPAVAVHGPGEPAVGPHPPSSSVGPRTRRSRRVSAPASKSATCTSATTAACARSRRRKVRTSASSVRSRTFARVNEFGFIETPYRVVKNGKVTDEIRYMAADEEEKYVVAQANTPINADGTFKDRARPRASQPAGREPRRPRKRMLEAESFFGATTDIASVPPDEVQLMDVSPKQIVSVATALIPFLEHDDANRALMGANMQRQAVPLVRAEAPYIGTGIEDRAARDAADLIQATGAGEVLEVSGDAITVQYDDGRQAGLPPGEVPSLEPGHLHQPPRPGEGGREGQQGHHPRRRSRRPITASWPSARTCSSP